jgi:hypothetical protein
LKTYAFYPRSFQDFPKVSQSKAPEAPLCRASPPPKVFPFRSIPSGFAKGGSNSKPEYALPADGVLVFVSKP